MSRKERSYCNKDIFLSQLLNGATLAHTNKVTINLMQFFFGGGGGQFPFNWMAFIL